MNLWLSELVYCEFMYYSPCHVEFELSCWIMKLRNKLTTKCHCKCTNSIHMASGNKRSSPFIIHELSFICALYWNGTQQGLEWLIKSPNIITSYTACPFRRAFLIRNLATLTISAHIWVISDDLLFTCTSVVFYSTVVPYTSYFWSL